MNSEPCVHFLLINMHHSVTDGRSLGIFRRKQKWAMNKIPWWIDCEKGDLILPGLLGIMMGPIGLGNRFQPTSIINEMGKRGIFNGSNVFLVDWRWLEMMGDDFCAVRHELSTAYNQQLLKQVQLAGIASECLTDFFQIFEKNVRHTNLHKKSYRSFVGLQKKSYKKFL